MNTYTDWRQEARATVNLAVPLALTQLAYVAMTTTDVVMMGWLGTDVLAAGSLAWHLYGAVEFSAAGLLSAVAPILSQHLGARRFRMIRGTVRQGAWGAVIVSVPCIALLWQAQAILVLLGQDPDIAGASQSYLRYIALGFLPGLWYWVLSEFLAAHARPRATLVISIIGVGVNAVADYALMFGHFGYPQLGLIGAGIASAIVSNLMFLAVLGFVLVDRRFRRYRLLGRFWRADWPRLAEIIRLGVPFAVTELAEMGMFLAAALLMGMIGTETLAAHAIVVQCYAIVFMGAAGLFQAASVRVGRAVGAGDHPATARAGWTAIGLGAVFALLPAAVFWLFGREIAEFFLDSARPQDLPTIDLAVLFLTVAALAVIVDSAQVVTRGALLGVKDTRGPMLIALAGHWGLGLPMAALFGVYLGFGGEAIWICLFLAMSVVSIFLARRFQIRSRLPIHMLQQG